MEKFPNYAGNSCVDDAIAIELKTAGITVEYMPEITRRQHAEMRTIVIGDLHGWTFERAWYYWICSGPGIEVEAAEKLHATHGQSVRVAGHCGCPSPREWYEGLACGLYHVDNQEGLNALAATIRELVAKAKVSDNGVN